MRTPFPRNGPEPGASRRAVTDRACLEIRAGGAPDRGPSGRNRACRRGPAGRPSVGAHAGRHKAGAASESSGETVREVGWAERSCCGARSMTIGRGGTPTLPWACLAARAPRPTFMAGRVPADVSPGSSKRASRLGRRSDADRPSAVAMVVATSLLGAGSGPPARPTPSSQGIASTAWAPFTGSREFVPDHLSVFVGPRLEPFPAGRRSSDPRLIGPGFRPCRRPWRSRPGVR